MLRFDARSIYREAVANAAAAAAPAQQPQPTADVSATGQQLIDFFKQSQTVDTSTSRTLSELARNPRQQITNIRQTIERILGETQYSQEIPGDIGQIFLNAIEDYETVQSQQGSVHQGGPAGPQASNIGGTTIDNNKVVEDLQKTIKSLQRSISNLTAAQKKKAERGETVNVNVLQQNLNSLKAEAEAAVNKSEAATGKAKSKGKSKRRKKSEEPIDAEVVSEPNQITSG